MKTTIDIPDEIYRKVKAKSALQGRRVRDVTVELYRRWIEGERARGGASPAAARNRLRAVFAAADRAVQEAPAGPSAREILEEDRNRLERR
jgi:hypothetical protein